MNRSEERSFARKNYCSRWVKTWGADNLSTGKAAPQCLRPLRISSMESKWGFSSPLPSTSFANGSTSHHSTLLYRADRSLLQKIAHMFCFWAICEERLDRVDWSRDYPSISLFSYLLYHLHVLLIQKHFWHVAKMRSWSENDVSSGESEVSRTHSCQTSSSTVSGAASHYDMRETQIYIPRSSQANNAFFW